jgi:hypothetical protein
MKQEFTLKKTYEVTTTIEIVKNNDRYYAKVHRNFDDLWEENDEYECWIDDPSNPMTEENSTEAEYDAIIETFCSYINANGVKFARQCSECKKGMNSGYIIGNGDEYYCSDECLHKEYTPAELELMDVRKIMNFVLFDNQLITI